ncbi:hypothetical protein NECID01_0223 [Nematocida sp. AWRm77]|nr:hypothetical protein NECID01_0223 [Nematocida sp. AWRm77]
MQKTCLFLFFSLAWGYYTETDVGFLLIPRNNSETTPVALTVYGKDISFSKVKTKHKSAQVFIQESIEGGKICLKYSPNRCLKLSSSMFHKDVSFFKKQVQCKRSVKKSRINVHVTLYPKTVMLNLENCSRICLFHHNYSESPKSTNFAPILDYCKPGNLNNMYRTVPENKLVEYIADLEVESEMAKAPSNTDYSSPGAGASLGADSLYTSSPRSYPTQGFFPRQNPIQSINQYAR